MKMRFHLFVGFICLTFAVACGDDGGNTNPGTDGSVEPETSVEGTTYKYVVSQLRIGELMASGNETFPFIAPGFNLDNQPDNACGNVAEDHISPSPDNEEGVDNKLISVAADVKNINAEMDFEQLIQDGLSMGDLVIAVEVTAEDLVSGPASVSFYTGTFDGDVQWTGNALAAGQDLTTNTKITTATGTISNGRLEVSLESLPVKFPAETAEGGEVSLTIGSAKARFNISESALTDGFIGGALNTEAVITEIMKFESSFPEGVDEAFVRSALTGVPDLEPDNSSECQAISAGLYVSGTTANF